MRVIVSLFLVLSLYARLTAAASPQEPDPSTRPAVDARQVQVALLPWANFVRDEAGNKTIDEVLDAIRSGDSTRIDKEVFSNGFSAAAYWFVIPLENNRDFDLDRQLIFNPSWLDDVRVTLIDAHGEAKKFEGGDTLPFSKRSEAYRRVNFALTLSPGRSLLIVRTETRDPYFVGIDLMERQAFEHFVGKETLYFGLLYGGLMSLLLFNLILFLASREKSYLAYCAWLFAFIVMHATYNGHVFRWLLPESPNAHNWATSGFIYVYCVCGLFFALSILDLNAKLPTAYIWTWRLIYALALSFVLTAVLGGYRAHVVSSIAWVVVFAACAFTLGLLSLQKRNTAAVYYLSASTAGLIGSTITALTVMGFLPYSFMTFRAVDFGISIDAVMLSLALSARLGQARRLERLRRFFSPAVANQLLSASSDELYAPHHREIVVLFLDLRGYTAFTQKHGADEVMRILGEFHAAMGEIIATYEATLERFAGDGMMIFLNDPVEIPDPAMKAGKMALEMQARFHELNKIWQQRSYSLSMGIGIAQGMATIGAIGFEGRRDYAAIGNVTNLAARLCGEAAGGQILICSVVAAHLEKELRIQSIGSLVLKGFAEPVACHEIAPLPQQQTAQLFTVAIPVAA